MTSKAAKRLANLKLAHKLYNMIRDTIDAAAFRRLMAGEALTAAEMWPTLMDAIKGMEK